MAKQVGPVFFTGTIDGFIFYKLGDHYYTRAKGSYKSAKHMRRNPKYKRTMQKADQFGQAAKLTQEVYYRHLPKEVRKQGLFGKLTGMVNGWLQEGKSPQQATQALIAYCQTVVALSSAVAATPAVKTITPKAPAPSTQTPKTKKAQPAVVKPFTPPIKQARYLSSWKVKPNGHLRLPTSTAGLPTLIPLVPHPEEYTKLHAEPIKETKHSRPPLQPVE